MSEFVPEKALPRNPSPLRPVAPPAADPRRLAEPDDAIDVRGIFRVLRRHIWLVALATAAVTAVVAVLVSRQEPRYQAEATIRLKDERQSLTGSMESQAIEQMLGKTADPLLSQLQVMRSRTVAWEVVQRTGLQLYPIEGTFPVSVVDEVSVSPEAVGDTLTFRFRADGFTVSTGGTSTSGVYGRRVQHAGVAFNLHEQPSSGDALVEVLSEPRATTLVLESLSATAVDRTDVVRVSYVSTDPEVAQRVLDTAIDVFQTANAADAQQQSRRRRMFVEEQLLKTEAEVELAQEALSGFRRREGVLSSREQFAAQQMGVFELDIRREELISDRSVYASLLAALRGNATDPDRGLRALISAPGIADNPIIVRTYEQLAAYQGARDSLTTGEWGSAAESPDVRRLDTLIARTQRSLADAAESHLAAVDARIRSLDELKGRSVAEIQLLPEKEAEEMRLLQRFETAHGIAELLREEYQMARISEAVEAGQVEIIDSAAYPEEPMGASPALKIALGMMLGLVVGVGGAFLKDSLNTSISRKEDLEEILGLHALAVIPRIDPAGKPSGPPLRLPIRRGSIGTEVMKPLSELITVTNSSSPGAEAYRSLRTNLIFSQAAHGLGTLMVTSPMAAEGKTTTASNLAVAFTHQGLRVLLIDCDLRKPRQHQVFGLSREPGLVDAIIGTVGVADAARSTDVSGLDIVTAGITAPNPSELLGSTRMRAIMDELQDNYDLVLVDAPPVLVAGDASILGSMVDGTIMVVRVGKTDTGAAKVAVDQLRAVGARLLGGVLNDPNAKLPSYGAYYHQAYQYYGEEAS